MCNKSKQVSKRAPISSKHRRQKRDEIGFTQETTIKKWGEREGKGKGETTLFSIFQFISKILSDPSKFQFAKEANDGSKFGPGLRPETRTHGAKFDAARATNFSRSSPPSINHRDKPSQHRIHRILEFVVLVFDEIIDENNEE